MKKSLLVLASSALLFAFASSASAAELASKAATFPVSGTSSLLGVGTSVNDNSSNQIITFGRAVMSGNTYTLKVILYSKLQGNPHPTVEKTGLGLAEITQNLGTKDVSQVYSSRAEGYAYLSGSLKGSGSTDWANW